MISTALGKWFPGLQSFATWCDSYDAIIAARALKPKTLQNRRNNVAHLVQHLGHRPMRSIRPAEIASAVRAVWNSGRRVTARGMLIEARDIFNEAVIAGVLNQNPALPLRQLPAPVMRSRLTFEQWQAIYEWVIKHGQPWFAYALRLALVTAQRRADLVKMLAADVWDEHLHIIQQKTRACVALPLTLHLQVLDVTLGQVIAEAGNYRRPGNYLLRKRHDKPFGTAALSASFTAARDAVFPRETWEGRTPPTFHEIRSLSERLYRAQGVDTKTLLGHKRQSMTDEYNNDRGLSIHDWKTLVL